MRLKGGPFKKRAALAAAASGANTAKEGLSHPSLLFLSLSVCVLDEKPEWRIILQSAQRGHWGNLQKKTQEARGKEGLPFRYLGTRLACQNIWQVLVSINHATFPYLFRY